MIEENASQVDDHIYIINPEQPYTFKDGHYTVIGTPMNELEVQDENEGQAGKHEETAQK